MQKNFKELENLKHIPEINLLTHKTHRFNSNLNLFNLQNKNFLMNNDDYEIAADNLKINENGDIEENYIEEIINKLHHCENTLPGYMISIMLKKGIPISEEEIKEMMIPKINDLRKPDGSKYKVIKSTLSCSGIFYKADPIKNLWYFKNQDAYFYIQRTANKSNISNKEIKNKSDSSSICINKIITDNKVKHKKCKIQKSLRIQNYKMINAYNILDDMLSKYKNDIETSKKLKNPFSNCENCFDLIKKFHGDENKIFGILATFKFFKPLISKMLKIMSHNKKPPKKQLTKLNMKMEDLENKLELFQQLFSRLEK